MRSLARRLYSESSIWLSDLPEFFEELPMSFRDRNLGEREEAGFAIGIVLAGQAS
jgi:hypothetical protein